MKKLLKPLFTALFAGMVCTGAKAAEPQVINIRTNDLSMVMSVAPNGEVLFHHFGGRIDDASPAAGIKSYRRTDHGTDNLAYSTMGGRNFREPALRVTHADGDMNTELRYVSHATRTLVYPPGPMLTATRASVPPRGEMLAARKRRSIAGMRSSSCPPRPVGRTGSEPSSST